MEAAHKLPNVHLYGTSSLEQEFDTPLSLLYTFSRHLSPEHEMRGLTVPQDEIGAEDGAGRPGAKGTLWPLALATQLGVTMGVMTVFTVLASLYLGSWVDRQFGTRPLATLLFILLGVLAGFLGTINLAQSTVRQINTAAAQEVRVRTAFLARDLGRALLLVLELALVTLVPNGLALWLGLWLDRATGSGPLFIILMTIISLIGALFAVFLIARGATRRAGPST